MRFDSPRPTAEPPQDRGPGPRTRARGGLTGGALPTLLACSLSLCPPAAADSGRVAESPTGGPASAAEVTSNPARPALAPRLFGPSRQRPGASPTALRGSPTASTRECSSCEPAHAFAAADFERPNQVHGSWLPLDPERPIGFPASSDFDGPAPDRGPLLSLGRLGQSGGTEIGGAIGLFGGWMPIVRGQQRVYRGRSNADGTMLDHVVTFTVTDLLKDIGGVPCAVAWIKDVDGGQLVESLLSFFAQDRAGDVWHTGEYAEEYELGQFVTAEASWIHGIHRARGGILVQRRPTPGASRELVSAPRIAQLDCGSVISVEQGREASVPGVCVPAGCYREVMTLEEWAPLESCPEFLHRVYARGVGLIQAGDPDDPEGETLVLEQVRQLGGRELDAAREAALALDTHGPEVNEVYSLTRPVYHVPRPAGQAPAPHASPADQEVTASFAARSFLRVGRDPVRAGTALRYGLERDAQIELGIFDLAGRRVRMLVNRSEAAGVHHAHWDGRDQAGSAVARGVYFARLRVGTQVLNRTLVLLP